MSILRSRPSKNGPKPQIATIATTAKITIITMITTITTITLVTIVTRDLQSGSSSPWISSLICSAACAARTGFRVEGLGFTGFRVRA